MKNTLEMTVAGSDFASEVAKQLIWQGTHFSCVCMDSLNELYAFTAENGKALALIVADAKEAFKRAECAMAGNNIIAFKKGGETVLKPRRSELN